MKTSSFVSLVVTLAMILSVSAVSANSLNDRDMNLAFGANIKASKMTVLSRQEMLETKGEFWPWVVRMGFGAIGGGSSYYGQYAATGNWSWGGFGRSVGGGALGGLIGIGYNPWASATIGAFSGAFSSNCCSNRFLNW